MTEQQNGREPIHETPQQVASERRGLVRILNPFGRIWLRLVARVFEHAADLVPAIIPKQLNLTWVTDDLAVGGMVKKRDYRRLAAMGITAIVDAREEAVDDAAALAEVGIKLLHLPTPDRHSLTPADLSLGARWAAERLADGGKVFVHCQHGVGRGPLLGCAVLMANGLSAPEALRTVRARRWQAAPNDRQIEGLLVFEEYWRAERTRDAPDGGAEASAEAKKLLPEIPL